MFFFFQNSSAYCININDTLKDHLSFEKVFTGELEWKQQTRLSGTGKNGTKIEGKSAKISLMTFASFLLVVFFYHYYLCIYFLRLEAAWRFVVGG
jgi:hypothetical protein